MAQPVITLKRQMTFRAGVGGFVTLGGVATFDDPMKPGATITQDTTYAVPQPSGDWGDDAIRDAVAKMNPLARVEWEPEPPTLAQLRESPHDDA